MRLPTTTVHQPGFGEGEFKDGWKHEMINWDHVRQYSRDGEHMTLPKAFRISHKKARRGTAIYTVYRALGTEYFRDKFGYTVWPTGAKRDHAIMKVKGMLNLQDADTVDSDEIAIRND